MPGINISGSAGDSRLIEYLKQEGSRQNNAPFPLQRFQYPRWI